MTHTVTIPTQVQLEEYFILKSVVLRDAQHENQEFVVNEKEFGHYPTPEDIAKFLVESHADFVSVSRNYRISGEIPFV